MSWIESHTSLARHPKTIRLAKALDTSVPAAIGHLHLLWWWSLEYAQEGDLGGFDVEELAEAACYEGEPEVFVAALKRARFVDDDGHLHDWQDYAGRLIERRQANTERMRNARAQRAPSIKEDRAQHVQDTCDARAGTDVAHVQGYRTVPDLTGPDRTVPTGPDQTGETGADAPPTALEPEKPSKAKRVTIVDEEFTLGLVAQWVGVLSEEQVREAVATAMAHKSRKNYTDLKQYVRNWVRGNAERAAERSKGNGRVSVIGGHDGAELGGSIKVDSYRDLPALTRGIGAGGAASRSGVGTGAGRGGAVSAV